MTPDYNKAGHRCPLTQRLAVTIAEYHILCTKGFVFDLWLCTPVVYELNGDPWTKIQGVGVNSGRGTEEDYIVLQGAGTTPVRLDTVIYLSMPPKVSPAPKRLAKEAVPEESAKRVYYFVDGVRYSHDSEVIAMEDLRAKLPFEKRDRILFDEESEPLRRRKVRIKDFQSDREVCFTTTDRVEGSRVMVQFKSPMTAKLFCEGIKQEMATFSGKDGGDWLTEEEQRQHELFFDALKDIDYCHTCA